MNINKEIITAIINKFKSTHSRDVIVDSPDVFILVDETHRTQGGVLHTFMKEPFPKGCYLGFTGTPLLKKEKKISIEVFGKMIDKYTIDQGVRDKAILPLLYEGRMISQEVKDNNWLDKRFDIMTKNLSEKQKIELKNKWSRFEKVASSEHRLLAIVLDIEMHFNNNFRCNGQLFKGMLATNSKYEAVKYQELFEENTNLKTAVVVSDSDARVGYDSVNGENKDYVVKYLQKLKDEYGDLKRYEERIKEDFIKIDEIDILIVVDKLLTGFDAPKATVLYIDKQLKDHQLLQAIARVNRLYEGKEYGYIVDYRGLLGNLDKALTEYASLAGYDLDDVVGTVTDIKVEMAKVKTYYSHLITFFKEIKNKTDLEEYILFLDKEEKREDNPSFYDSLSEKIEKTIEEYEAKRLSDEEYLKNMQDIRERMKKGENTPEVKKEHPSSIKDNTIAIVFYDNIFPDFTKIINNEEELAIFSIKIVEKLTEISKKPDWETNSDIHNEIAGFIEELLWDLEDEYNVKFDNLNEIIENVISIGIRRFSKRGY